MYIVPNENKYENNIQNENNSSNYVIQKYVRKKKT